MRKGILLSTFVFACNLVAGEKGQKELLKEDNRTVLEYSEKVAQFYELGEGEEIKEITEDLFKSELTRPGTKKQIQTTGRRFFVFQYPSGGFMVKGYMSFVPNPAGHSLLVFLRGGSNMFGLMNPANAFACMGNYTVLATAYRGGVSEGLDEWGGKDIDDVQNMIDYLPVLEKKLAIAFHPQSTYILGGGRGAMQMFLALAKSPSLQQRISKVVSLRGPLDLHEHFRFREDLLKSLMQKYELKEEEMEMWIQMRNPIATIPFLRKDLPILIIHSPQDFRVNPREGLNMMDKLKENGHLVECLDIPDMDQVPIHKIADWLEK